MPVELLVIAPHPDSPFVEADVRGLREHFSVERIAFSAFRNKADFSARLFLRFLRRDVRALLLWFLAPAYALEAMAIARSFGRPVAVMTGGLDIDYVPALKRGGLRWPHNRLRQKIGLRAADLVLSMSEFSTGRIRRLARPRRLETVPMGVDVEHFSPAGEKEDLVLSVCFEITRETAPLKGLPTLVEAARRLPNVPFVVVGRRGADDGLARLKERAPANVSFTERFISDAELLELYRRAKVYVQISAHEGFGLAVAESMACGCVPVVTGEHALREVVGDAGLYVPYGDAAASASAIQRALAEDGLGAVARDRVASRFTMERRIERLAAALRPLIELPPDGRVRVDLGCGNNKRFGCIGVDSRQTRATDIVCDIRQTPFDDGSVDELYAACVLEHFENPYLVLDEIVRILKPDGTAVIRLPNLGTYSAHLDTDHKFLADLKLWRTILSGYFDEVGVKSIGSKYRDNPALTALSYAAIHGLRFHELAQGWDFRCARPRATPVRRYTGWWLEEEA